MASRGGWQEQLSKTVLVSLSSMPGQRTTVDALRTRLALSPKALADVLKDLLGRGLIVDSSEGTIHLSEVGSNFASQWEVPTNVSKTPARTRTAPARTPPTETDLLCSFCGKSQHDVKKLIAGPSVFICDECIQLTADILEEENGGTRYSKALEFPPEYRQAGLAILSYFGTVVRQKYPDDAVNVRIEQDGVVIRMFISSSDGEIEKIEQTFEQYRLVLKGQEAPESLGLKAIETIELKAELRLAHARIAMQQELLAYQGASLERLGDLLQQSITADRGSMQITVSPQIQQTAAATTNVLQSAHDLCDVLGQLQSALPSGHPALPVLAEAAAAAQDASLDPENLRKPELAAKLKKAAEYVSDTSGSIHKTLENVEGSADILKRLGRCYNSVALLCGLPSIPFL